MTASKAPGSGSTSRFNPNSESTDTLQVAASNWEVLHRVPLFRRHATKWVQSKAFRFAFGCKNIYSNNDLARCALDWMLTVGQRTALAEHQMNRLRFKWNPDANYGPILVQTDFSRQNKGLRECIRDLFDLTPNPDPAGTLHIGQPWPATPEKFRRQFLSIIDQPDLRKLDLADHALTLRRIGNNLISGKPVSSEEQIALGRYLFQQGEYVRLLAAEYKIAAIRRAYYPEKQIDDILKRIKSGLVYERRTGRDRSSSRSFLGSPFQWDKFLAWEAHSENAYRAAGEFLSKSSGVTPKAKRGRRSRSEMQRDAAASVRQAVKAIQQWYPKIYPVRKLTLPDRSAVARIVD